MIQYTPNNWFECKYPQLESHEEEIFFQHPTEDIRCNQLGILYYDEIRYISYDMRTGTIVREHGSYNGVTSRPVGTKQKVIWECYHNQLLKTGSHFLYVNGNPLDYSKGNLISTHHVEKNRKLELLAIKGKFVNNSVQRLIELEEKYKKRGIDSIELHELLQLPSWLMIKRKKWSGPVPKALVKKKVEKKFGVNETFSKIT